MTGGGSNRRGGERDGDWAKVVDEVGEARGPRDEEVELVQNPSAYENAHQYKYGGLPTVDVSPPRKSGLRMPPPPRGPSGPRPPASESTRLPDAVPKDLFGDPAKPRVLSGARPPPRQGRPQPLLFAALGVGLLVLAAVAYFTLRGPPPPPTGMISVVSDPEGADVFVDGSPTGQVTPLQLFEKEAGRGYLIQVRKEGFGVEPEVRSVSIEHEGDTVTAFFSLFAVRSLEIRTEPSRADLEVDGKAIAGRTPTTLTDLRVGSTIRIRAELPGHLPVEIEREITEDGSTSELLVLSEALGLTVVTEPDGAKVTIGDRDLGVTPLYDAPVTKGQRVTVRIEKAGYRPMTRTLRMTRDQQLDVRLNEVPLASLPLRRDERTEARRIDRALKSARRRATSAKLGVATAERNLNRILDDPRSMFAARARAERAVDKAQTQLISAEDGLVEAQAAADRFRARVLARDVE